ncbi:MAG TPA: tetratricopeptide repeat protein [Bryobacteraceae bacterium]|jgi:tetratricopeptide (TPR) repeat protein|nr:tetratricopeptide repeat protein [Bryobacteraceae bacterium]
MLRAAILFACAAPFTAHAADWIAIESPHFELLANAPEGAARKTLVTFERARDFFLREQPLLAGSPPRVVIIGFAAYDDYKRYSSKSGDLAYYLRNPRSEYIVISDLGLDRMRIALHEYLHLLVSHSHLNVPLWLNEGMAEVYSTLTERDGKLVLGEMKRDRVEQLGEGNWMHLPQLLRVDENSPGYNEEDLEGMFYAESCLLTHMLMLGDGYSAKFSTLLERISAAGSSQSALNEVYGKPTADIERDLRLYFAQKVRGGAVYRGAPAQVEIGDAHPASPLKVGVTLAGLTLALGREGEAKAKLHDLASQYPQSAEVEAALGAVDEARDQRDSALAHYRAAVALNSGGWEVYWNYARLLDEMGGDLDPRIRALSDAVERKPDFADARLRLTSALCTAARFSEALARLQQAPAIDPEHAVGMYAEMSLASYGLKQSADALRYGEQARAAAHTPEEKSAVAALYAVIQPKARGGTSTDTRAPVDDPDRPTLRRKSPPPPPKKGGNGGDAGLLL